MAHNRKILFPVDFSEGTQHIVPYVREMADQFQSEIHVLFVVHVAPYYEGIGVELTYVADFEAAVMKQAKTRMDHFLEQFFKGRNVVGKVMAGYPPEVILEYADQENIDLIIMGHSKKGIQRMIMGSVAGLVVKKSHVPVMIVNPEEAESAFSRH